MPSKREVRDALMEQGAREQWRLRLRGRFWVAVLVVVLVALSIAVGYLLAKESARNDAKREHAKTLQVIESDVDGLQKAVGELADPYGPFVVQCADGQMTGLEVFEDGSAAAICAPWPIGQN
jgi:flagellar basal body-associated protein FliL